MRKYGRNRKSGKWYPCCTNIDSNMSMINNADIYKWYSRNRLLINIDKSKVMIIGSIWQLKSLNLDDFVMNFDDTPLELVERAKYLGMFINSDISWDFHIQNLCKQMRYLLSLLRRLRSIFPENLLLQFYKSYIQPKLDYGLTIYYMYV